MSDLDASNDSTPVRPLSRFVDFISGARLTVVLFSLAIALLFFGSLDTARYGLDIASRAYFGSLIAIWQYPVEWPVGGVLCRFWLPLPGGPVVALGLLVNLGFACWRSVRGGWPKSFRRIVLGLAHAGVLVVVIGYVSLIFGCVFAKNVVISGAALVVVGLALYYLRALVDFVRARVDVRDEVVSSQRRRMSAHWFYAAALGAAAGAFLCSLNSRADLVTIFEEKRVELLPVLFYLISIVAAYLAWMRGERGAVVMRGFSAPLLSAGIAAHTLVVVLLVYIRRLPPAVDLYSTFVFAGWCGAMLAYYVERRRRDGVAGAAAALVASITLGIAYGVGNGFAERLNPMTISGVWLSLHVGTIVFGYGAVLLAVVLANISLVGRKFGLSADVLRMLTGLLYGSLAAGFVFVALGILMGGLWAESAWGRFWGWDPKENAALMLLIWCALALHAWRCGLVRDGGFAGLVALAGLVLGWSWVGTNLMGAGLHTYGLAGAGAWFLVGYAAAQLFFVMIFRPRTQKTPVV